VKRALKSAVLLEQRALVEQAYVSYGQLVLRRAIQLLRDEQEARDVVQEVFVALMDRPSRFEGRSALGTYLHSTTTHLCLNWLRNRRNRDRLHEGRAAQLAPAADATPPDVTAALRQVLAALPAHEARAAILHHLDGMSHAEIAARLRCSRRRIGDLLDRMRARLSRNDRREGGRG
jgi:RNA polymerase sigma factor (sigma-70 family)